MDREIVIPRRTKHSGGRGGRNPKIFDEEYSSSAPPSSNPRRSIESLFLSTLRPATTSASRITIPLPAVMSSITSISTGRILADDGRGQESQASLALDSEWFFLDSYPPDLRYYLSTRFSFDVRPKDSEDLFRITDGLLRNAYRNLNNVGLNIPIAKGLEDVFNRLTAVDPNDGRPLHPFNARDPENRSLYMILAYVLSVLLWKIGASNPQRSYTEPTYPGVIIASFVSRLDAYYYDIMKKLAINVPLISASSTSPSITKVGINEIPNLTASMRETAENLYGVVDPEKYCNDVDLAKDIALILYPGLDKTRTESCDHYMKLILSYKK